MELVKKTLVLKFERPDDRMAFLEKIQEVEEADYSVRMRELGLRIRLFGTKEQVGKWTKDILAIYREVGEKNGNQGH
ncbi:MAG: hypothetical protein AABX40_03395 [Candidatus Hydrothermarchaeota archaeon]